MQQQINIKDKINDIKNNKIIKEEDKYKYKDRIILKEINKIIY